MLLLGGLSYSQFSIVLAEVNDHLEHHHMASAGAHLVALNGLGAAAAPLLVAVAFLVVGNQGYDWVLSGVHAVTGLAVVTVAWAGRRSRQHRAAWTVVSGVLCLCVLADDRRVRPRAREPVLVGRRRVDVIDADEQYVWMAPIVPGGPGLVLQRVDEPKREKCRVHLDFRPADPTPPSPGWWPTSPPPRRGGRARLPPRRRHRPRWQRALPPAHLDGRDPPCGVRVRAASSRSSGPSPSCAPSRPARPA